MRYPTLLFDLDHTLLDSDESERLAYAHTMEAIGLANAGEHFDRYVTINREMWVAVEAGDLQPGEVRHRRFQRFVDELGIDADPHAMADAFVFGLSQFGELYDGAIEMLERVAESADMAMITNGLSMVQRTRIDRLAIGHLFSTVIISEEVGVTKPRREIFDRAFADLGDPTPSDVLMIGDSLTSDIAGGRNAGIDTCWYNPARHASPQDANDAGVTFEIAALEEIPLIAYGTPAP